MSDERGMPDPEPSGTDAQVDGGGAAPHGPEPPLSRRAAVIAMGAVVLALGLIWIAPGLDSDHTHVGEVEPLGEHEAQPEDLDAVGKEAPLDFTLQDMNGVDVHLASFEGKVILLNFWATWCGPCKAEIPMLIELQEQYADDLVVLGLSVDDTPEQLRPYAAEFGMNYPVLVGNGRDDVQEAYGPLWGIPVSVFIGRDGVIARRHSGIATREQFEQEIKALL